MRKVSNDNSGKLLTKVGLREPEVRGRLVTVLQWEYRSASTHLSDVQSRKLHVVSWVLEWQEPSPQWQLLFRAHSTNTTKLNAFSHAAGQIATSEAK